MSFPINWVDEIFSRLTVRYGSAFLHRWTSAGINLDLVRQDWAKELAGFENWPEAITFAFANLDAEKPPTASTFRAMALKAPKPDRPALPEPAADPERVALELKKLAPVRNMQGAVDHKAWAKRTIDRHEAGEPINLTTLRFAREALNMAIVPFAH